MLEQVTQIKSLYEDKEAYKGNKSIEKKINIALSLIDHIIENSMNDVLTTQDYIVARAKLTPFVIAYNTTLTEIEQLKQKPTRHS